MAKSKKKPAKSKSKAKKRAAKKPAKRVAKKVAKAVKKPAKKVAASRARMKASIKQTKSRTPGKGGQPMQAPQEENSLVTPASPPSVGAANASPMPTVPEPAPLTTTGGTETSATGSSAPSGT